MRLKAKLQLKRALKAIDLVIKNGGRVAFEWPRGNDGHLLNELREFVISRGLYVVDIDGRSVGVTNAKGEEVLKPWRFYANDQFFCNYMAELRCSGNHIHAPCAGNATESTAYYTETMAEHLLDAWQYPQTACTACPLLASRWSV